MAPRGPKRTTLSDSCDDRPLDPKKRGLAATSRIDEGGGSKRCRRTKGAGQKRPRRSKTKQTIQEHTPLRTNTRETPSSVVDMQEPRMGRKKIVRKAQVEETDIDLNVLLFKKLWRKSASNKDDSSRGCRGTKGARAQKFGKVRKHLTKFLCSCTLCRYHYL